MRLNKSLLALVALGLCAGLAAQGTYTDKQHGFKIKPPSGWVYLGQDNDLGQNGPVFAASREYVPTKVEGPGHTPTMRVLFFPKGAGAEPQSEGLPKRTPYRNFTDYLARVHGVGAEEKSGEVEKMGKFNGILTTAVASRPVGDLTLHAYRLDLDTGELVIEFEALTEQYAKLKKVFDKSLKSLAAVPATQTEAAAAANPWETDYAAWSKLGANERAAQREKAGKSWLADRPKMLGKGWTTKKIGPYVVESSAEAKFTKRAIEAATAVRAWVEGKFAGVSDEVVMPAAIRIYDGRRELSTLRLRELNTRAYDPVRREIYFFKDDRFGTTGEGYGELMRGILEQYLHDKHPEIVQHIPRWLDFGMAEYFRSSRYKKKKLEFFASTTENERILYYHEHDDYYLPDIWALIQESVRPSPENGEPEKPWDYTTECSRALRWFDAGGSELMGKKNFVQAYYQAIGTCGVTQPPDPAADVDWFRLKDAEARDLRKAQYEWRDKFLIEVNTIACNLTTPAWEKANAGWKKFNEEFKQ